MPSRRPSTSYKIEAAPVEELRSHAQTIPLLDYLVDDALDSIVLSPNQVVPVKLPAAERFALHKLYSSQRRGSQRDKARKDLEQAALLVAVLEEETPGLLGDVAKDLPGTAKAIVKRGARAALNIAGDHAEAAAFLRKLAR